MNDAVRSDSSPVLAVDAGQSSTRVRCEPGPWGPGWIVTSSGVRTALPLAQHCLLYTSPSPRDGLLSRMPSSA